MKKKKQQTPAPELPHCTDQKLKCHWKCETRCYMWGFTKQQVLDELLARMKQVLQEDAVRYG